MSTDVNLKLISDSVSDILTNLGDKKIAIIDDNTSNSNSGDICVVIGTDKYVLPTVRKHNGSTWSLTPLDDIDLGAGVKLSGKTASTIPYIDSNKNLVGLTPSGFVISEGGSTISVSATNLNTANAIVKRDASGNFSAGTITANITGNVSGSSGSCTGNSATATTAGSATNFTGSLAGDVTGTQGSTSVAYVGGVAGSSIASGANLANAATNANTVSTIVRRDSSGNFSAGTITANLTGNVSGSSGSCTGNSATATTAGSATNFTGSLAGDVTGTQGSTSVAYVGGVAGSSIASGANLANAATNANTVSTIVKRDSSGNFSAGTITANLTGGVNLTNETASRIPYINSSKNLVGLTPTGATINEGAGTILYEGNLRKTSNVYHPESVTAITGSDGTDTVLQIGANTLLHSSPGAGSGVDTQFLFNCKSTKASIGSGAYTYTTNSPAGLFRLSNGSISTYLSDSVISIGSPITWKQMLALTSGFSFMNTDNFYIYNYTGARTVLSIDTQSSYTNVTINDGRFKCNNNIPILLGNYVSPTVDGNLSMMSNGTNAIFKMINTSKIFYHDNSNNLLSTITQTGAHYSNNYSLNFGGTDVAPRLTILDDGTLSSHLIVPYEGIVLSNNLYQPSAQPSFNRCILYINNETELTNQLIYPLIVAHRTTGTQAAGMGCGIKILAEHTNGCSSSEQTFLGLTYVVGSSTYDAKGKIGISVGQNDFMGISIEKRSVSGGITNTNTTPPDVYSDECMWTKEGGYAVKMINRTGGDSIRGYAVCPSSTYDYACQYITSNGFDPIGIIYESGIADGSAMWVIVSGRAYVYYSASTTRKYLARGFVTGDSGYTAGQVYNDTIPNVMASPDKTFYVIGNVLESRTGAGLALTMLKF